MLKQKSQELSGELLLIKYEECFGNNGDLLDIFICNKLILKALKILEKMYRGAVLGKHSSVWSTFSDETLTLLTKDQDWIKKGIELKILNMGPIWLNPYEFTQDDKNKILKNFNKSEIIEIENIWKFKFE